MDQSNEPARVERAGQIGRKRPGAGLWVLWLLGFAVGGYVALQVGGVNRVRVGGVGEWAVAGLALGLAQWLALALGRYGSKIAWWAWIPATALGLAAGFGAGGAITGWSTIPPQSHPTPRRLGLQFTLNHHGRPRKNAAGKEAK